MTKKIKSVKAFGILNAYGEFWTNRTFDTELEAENYMNDFWGSITPRPSMDKHRVISVRISPLTKRRKR